ncbi:unnamed protein product [Scytosiphon promiscuus]
MDAPSPHYDIIKKYYPHLYFKHAKSGVDEAERYVLPPANAPRNRFSWYSMHRGTLQCASFAVVCRHARAPELDKNPEGKLFTCMDMKGTKLSMFAGEVKEFLVRSAKMVGAHYPERSEKIFILNAPWWFNVVWKFVTPFVHANTRAKVEVCTGNFMQKLEEFIDPGNVPQQAVGGQDPTEPLQSPQELQMREHVVNVLKEKGMEMKPIVSRRCC